MHERWNITGGNGENRVFWLPPARHDPGSINGRVEWRRERCRSAASIVSALSGFGANNHQTMLSFPPPPLKFRTAGFPQYGFKRAVSSDLRGSRHLYAATVEISSVRVLFRSRACARRHSRLLTPLARPVALGSASGCSVRQPRRLLWPHPSFCHSPPVSLLCRWPSDWQKFPNLLCLSLIPCRRLYSGGPRTLPTSARRWLGLRPSCRVSATTLVRTPDYVRVCLTKRQHSLNAAARNLAGPALDRTFTTELACARSRFHRSVMTT